MEKDSSKKEEKKLTDTQKEILITIGVLIICVIVGIFLGKIIYEAMYGPI